MIIGISGKIGTGKSHVAKFLKKKLGFAVIDSDKVKFNVIESNSKIKSDLTKTFGEKILHPNKRINRQKLSFITTKDLISFNVFAQTIFPQVGKQIRDIIRENETNYIIDASLPDKMHINNIFDVSILVTTSKRAALRRVGGKMPKKIFDNLWKFQKDVKNYDYVIHNASTIKDLKQDIDELIAEMFKK